MNTICLDFIIHFHSICCVGGSYFYDIFVSRLTGEQLQPFAGQIFANLLSVLEKPVSEENEYIMKGKQ